MTPTHIVADSTYGFIYTRDAGDNPLSLESASKLASDLNGIMPPNLASYAVYELVRTADGASWERKQEILRQFAPPAPARR